MGGTNIAAEEKERLAAASEEPRGGESETGPDTVAAGSPGAEKPAKLHARLALGVRDLGRAEQHAAELTRRGFSVVQTAPRGVSFEGDPELFESTFDCHVKVAESPCFDQRPKLPEELREDVDSIYFPTRPTFYGKERKK